MENLTLRMTKPEDREEYLALAKEFYSSDAVMHPVPLKNFERTFEELLRSDEYAACLMAEYGGAVAGYILIARTYSQEAGGEAVWLEEIYVRPDFRGRGIGRAMIEEIMRLFPAARYRLEIEPDNRRAAALYSRLGFCELGYGQMFLDKK